MMLLTSLLADHLVENPGVSMDVRANYSREISVFAQFLGHDPTVQDLTAANISGVMTATIAAGYKARTANNRRQCLMMLAKRAYEQGILTRAPKVNKIKEPRRIPRGFKVDEMTRILAACRQSRPLPHRMRPGRALGTWRPTDWEILVRLIWETGNRPTSLFTVRFCDVVGRALHLRGEYSKTGIEKPDTITVETADLVEQRRFERNACPEDMILVWPCERRHMWKALRREILTPAGIGKETALYGVLKGATSYIAKTMDVFAAAKFRGHTDVRTTMQHYIDPRITDEDEVAACDVLPRI